MRRMRTSDVDPGGGALGIGHLEEVEKQWKNLVQPGVEGEQASRHLVAGLGRRVGVGDGEVVPQQRQDGQQRNGPAMGDARGPPHRDAPSVAERMNSSQSRLLPIPASPTTPTT